MNLVTGIGLGAAIVNYKQAEKRYNEALQASEIINTPYFAGIEEIARYDAQKWDQLNTHSDFLNPPYDPYVPVEDLTIVPILYFSWVPLSSSKYRICTVLVITNTSKDKIYTIKRHSQRGLVAMFKVLGEETTASPNGCPFDIVLKPQTRVVLTVPVGRLPLKSTGDWMDKIKTGIVNYITEGMIDKTEGLRKLFGLFGEESGASERKKAKVGTIVRGALTTHTVFWYHDDKNKNIRQANYEGIPGVCVYMGDDYHPDTNWQLS